MSEGRRIAPLRGGKRDGEAPAQPKASAALAAVEPKGGKRGRGPRAEPAEEVKASSSYARQRVSVAQVDLRTPWKLGQPKPPEDIKIPETPIPDIQAPDTAGSSGSSLSSPPLSPQAPLHLLESLPPLSVPQLPLPQLSTPQPIPSTTPQVALSSLSPILPQPYLSATTLVATPPAASSSLPPALPRVLFPARQDLSSFESTSRTLAASTRTREGGINQLLSLAGGDPGTWQRLVGLYFQGENANPRAITDSGGDGDRVLDGGLWEKDLRKMDMENKETGSGGFWRLEREDSTIRSIAADIVADDSLGTSVHLHRRSMLEEAIRRWARKGGDLYAIVVKAGWTCHNAGSRDWWIMYNIKKMDECAEKERQLHLAQTESPLFYEWCMKDRFCGAKQIKRKRDDGEEETYSITLGESGRRETLIIPKPESKKLKMTGRPTQFHAVPPEERAEDSQGKPLPWSLEWPNDHPNAYQNRRKWEPAEKGPFGKNPGRKGSRRSTRTTTPAKKENPALDGFEAAMKYDAQKAAEAQRLCSGTQADSTPASHHITSLTKEPTQAILYGFYSTTQWAAIDWYEKVSGGLICEDYERQPPIERKKYPNFRSSRAYVHPRSLTQAERKMAFNYRGGECWIKVTFDSAEAAERAIYYSPHLIQGHWVYAEAFNGHGPEVDEPIPIRYEDDDQGRLSAPYLAHRPSQTLGPSFSMSSQSTNAQTRPAATLPRSFTLNATVQADYHQTARPISKSPSTASSTTAIGPDYPDLRRRNPPPTEENRSSNIPQNIGHNVGQEVLQDAGQNAGQNIGQNIPQVDRDPRNFLHFPDIPRNIIRPAHEAFLPQPTWTERTLQRLAEAGWIPGDIIGHVVPRLENGEFDWENASWYWKCCRILDDYLGTDTCGMRED